MSNKMGDDDRSRDRKKHNTKPFDIYAEFNDESGKYNVADALSIGLYDDFASFDMPDDMDHKSQSLMVEAAAIERGATEIDWGQMSMQDKVGSKKDRLDKIRASAKAKLGFSDQLLSGLKEKYSTPSKSSAVWVEKLEYHDIHDRKIKRGFYYLSNGHGLSGSYENPAVVSVGKPVGAPALLAKAYTDNTLSYWPSYDKISARCRGAYLDFLASQRDHPETPISYIFIYFSGLEYRVINEDEQISDDEYLDIYKEVIRLHSIYGTNHSFGKYSSNFIAYLKVSRQELIDAYEQEYPLESALLQKHLAPSNKISVARSIAEKGLIDTELAWGWLNDSGNYNFKTPSIRLSDEFSLLFRTTFNQKYPIGMPIIHNGSSLNMVYEPSNFSVGRTRFPFKDLPEPSSFTKPLMNIINIADECNQALDPVSRYLSKDGTSKDDLDAIVMMPRVLVREIISKTNLMVGDIHNWMMSIISDAKGLSTTDELWRRLNQPLPESGIVTAAESKEFQKDSRRLVLLIEAMGYGVAPDKRYHNEDLIHYDSFVVFDGAHPENFLPSDAYNDAKAIINLAATIAKSDRNKSGNNDNKESVALHNTVESILAIVFSALTLDDNEKKSLEAYALWKLTNNSDSIKLTPKKDHFKVLDGSDEKTANLVMSAAFSVNIFNKQRVGKAEKVYAYLGHNKSDLPSIIHKLQTSGLAAEPARDSGRLDMDKLRRYEAETKSSANILHTVFAAELEQSDNVKDIEPIEIADIHTEAAAIGNQLPTESAEPEGNTSIIKGLDAAHSDLYSNLIEKEEWSAAEVNTMCQTLGLMLSGAIETINDWAFDNIDAPVIEECDGEIIVDHESVDELKNTI